MADIRERIRARQSTDSKPRTIQINIGLDYGTAFTKCCYKVVGRPETHLLPMGGPDQTIESVIYLDSQDRLYHPLDKRPPGAKACRYSKMALLGTLLERGPAEEWAESHHRDLRDVHSVLASFYLARTLRWTMAEIRRRLATSIGGTPVDWSGNIGFAVKDEDTPHRKRVFQKVVDRAVAWALSPDPVSDNLRSLIGHIPGHPIAHSFALVSELRATLVGLTRERTTKDGLYYVIDVGGGTVDVAGVAFRRVNGHPTLNILSAEVKPIGAEVLKSKRRSHQSLSDEYQGLVSQLWVHSRTVADHQDKISSGTVCYFTGGGWKEPFYRNATDEAYRTRKHERLSFPPPRALDMPKPLSEVSQAGAVAGFRPESWGRFVLAYGLAVEQESMPTILGLPSVNHVRVPRADERLVVKPVSARLNNSSVYSNLRGDYDG